MELNSKKLERTSTVVYYSISVILCVFLALLAEKIIGDLDRLAPGPAYASFENNVATKQYEQEASLNDAKIAALEEKKNSIQNAINTAKQNHANEKQSFDNWLQTRKTLGSPDKDVEVISRAKKLDEYYSIEQQWGAQLNIIQQQQDSVRKGGERVNELLAAAKTETEVKYEKALQAYELKVFLIRLLFVAPILAIGIFFWIKFRKHKFWPIFFGFTLFSLYAFFIGLVPYLPSYGGYVRYGVGVVLSLGIGYYSIRQIRNYIDQKQAELKVSSNERSKSVQSETAEKALEAHICPSCGKDFILKKWEFPLGKNLETESYKLVTDFCRHCGLELFKNCASCGNKNFAHIPYCASCGVKTGEKAG